MTTLRIAIVLTLLGPSGLVGEAAEIELRRECRPAGGIVTLGDLALIHAADPTEARNLAAVELLPSPPPGQQRFLRAGELQDLLLLRGITLAQHRLSGSSQVAVCGAGDSAEGTPEPLPAAMLRKAHHTLSEALTRHLRQATGGSGNWAVTVELDDAQARLVSQQPGSLAVRGGAPPWTGRQVFEVTAGLAGDVQRFSIEAFVSLPPSVVVTAHGLPRGAVIGPADVRLAPGAASQSQADAFHSIEEVLGSETIQSIGEGAMVPKRAVRAPLLVHRGEIVTVYARAAGISVRTAARVRDDGSLGELVSVESLADRKAFIARVCGIRELEVFARAAQAESAAAPVPGGARE